MSPGGARAKGRPGREHDGSLRVGKLCAAAVLLAFGMAVWGYHLTESFWPWFPTFGGVSALAVFAGVVRRRGLSLGTVVGLVAAVGVAYQVGIFALSPTVPRIDGQAHAVQAQWMLESGTTAVMRSDFYDTVALFNLLTATTSKLTGLRADDALVVYPLALSIAVPVVAVILARRVRPAGSRVAFGTAALLGALGISIVQIGSGPETQAITVPMLVVAIWAIVRYARTGCARTFAVAAVTMGGLALSHKVPVVVLLAVVLTATCAAVIVGLRPTARRRLVHLTFLTGLVLALQWVFATVFFETVVETIVETVLGFVEEGAGIGPGADTTHAEHAIPSTVMSVVHNVHLTLYALSFVAALALTVRTLRTDRTPENVVLLSATLVLGIWVGLGTVTPLIGGNFRALVYGQIFFAIVIGIWIGEQRTPAEAESRHSRLRAVKLLLVAVVLLAQFGAVTATPDHPDGPRLYLTHEEVENKDFQAEFIDEVVYADRYFSNVVTDPRRPVERGHRYEMATVAQPWHPGIVGRELLTGTLIEQEYPYVSYREIDIYRIGGWYRLTWDPESALDETYNRIYSSGDVHTYAMREEV